MTEQTSACSTGSHVAPNPEEHCKSATPCAQRLTTGPAGSQSAAPDFERGSQAAWQSARHCGSGSQQTGSGEQQFGSERHSQGAQTHSGWKHLAQGLQKTGAQTGSGWQHQGSGRQAKMSGPHPGDGYEKENSAVAFDSRSPWDQSAASEQSAKMADTMPTKTAIRIPDLIRLSLASETACSSCSIVQPPQNP
jgi:hypothetical protein